MHLTAPVTNISRCSLHDGPGIRTVVYFKGCGMRCKWCHNPETLSLHKQILYIKSKCIGCGKCVEVCPEHHKINEDNIVFFREGCTSCGKCADICPALALTKCGEEKTVFEVFEEIKKDVHYYISSGGGVTFSGGECLLNSQFVAQLSSKCKEHNIHTAIESAFYVPWENVERVIPFTDLFFADLKIADCQKHKQFTGCENTLIIENIHKLSNLFDNIILRMPIIPNVNDSEEDIDAFFKIINTFGNGIKGIELLRYNNLSESKYAITGLDYVKFANDSQTDEEMKKYCTRFSQNIRFNCYFV